MFNKKSFEDNIYMKIFYWAYLILFLNVTLIVTNIPFFLASLFLSFLPGNYWIFWLALILFGPGMITVLACVDEFYETHDLSLWKSLKKYFRAYFVRGLAYWGIFLVALLISLMDIWFFYQTSMAAVAIPVFIVLSVVALAISLSAMYFQIRNPKSKIKDILRASFYYSLKKWYASILNVVLLLAMITLMILKPQFGFILTPTIFLGIIYLNCRKLNPDK